MTKFKQYALLLLAAVMVFGCSKYDDTELRNDVSDLQSRVEKLEKWCETANGQITALQGLVTALQGNDYVKGVTPVMEGTKEVGYTITFTKGSPITIMHGKDGVNGTTPVIGVKKHSDELYYWTIQTGSGEATWMKDADGNMIPTTGKDGGTGQKPVISVAKDGDRYYWQVDGKWLEDADGNKVSATGEKGDNGAAGADGKDGDSFFDSVTPDAVNGSVVFKLADGTEITLPMLSTTISFDAYTPLQIAATVTETEVKVILPATLKKADFAAIKADITNVAGTNSAITRADPEKWTVALTAPTFKADGTLNAQPAVKVTVPATATKDETALLEVTVVDTKGNKSTSTRVLYYSNQIAVTGVTLDNATLTVKAGKTGTLTATVAPINASNPKVNWTTSDATIATVAADGVVTGVKAGTATITATTEDGRFTATCAVTVENIAVTGITLTDVTVSLGGKKTLTPTITPTDATIQTVTWSSSNIGVATINVTTGEVTTVAKGETTITATSTSNTTVIGTCKVTVTKALVGTVIGDFYLSDGTIISKDVTLTSEQKANCIGVVFSVNWNDPTKGKIVSLDEGTNMNWSTENIATNAKDENDGASNTNTIKNLSSYSAEKYPPVAWCLNKGTGWYLPSTGELGLLYNARVTLNNSLNSLSSKGAMPFNYNFYWASNEFNDTNATLVYFDVQGSSPVEKQTDSKSLLGVRAVLTFE